MTLHFTVTLYMSQLGFLAIVDLYQQPSDFSQCTTSKGEGLNFQLKFHVLQNIPTWSHGIYVPGYTF